MEYHRYFLIKNGLREDYADSHNEKHHELQRSLKGEMNKRSELGYSQL